MNTVRIEQDLLVKYRIIDPDSPSGQKANNFLLSRAKLLAGRYIDFDETPITFVLSDSGEPNAFFMPKLELHDKPEYDRERNVIFTNNPIGTHVVCVTRGLIDMVDNQDEFDYVLSHELTHIILNEHGSKRNSGAEETISDLHAVDLVYDAAGDPKQALVFMDKLTAYAKDQEKQRYSHSWSDEDKSAIHWSEILDVHMTARNRRSALEASLTRLSHLIDDRLPTSLDKTVFDAAYSDPVDIFLNERDYEQRKLVGKLKILIDAIDGLAVQSNPRKDLQNQMAKLIGDGVDEDDYETRSALHDIQKLIDKKYEDCFAGRTLEKKYQQKIATMAYDLIQENDEARRLKKAGRSAEINGQDLLIYLQNEAYRHISAHGYPADKDVNYLDAASILYSYFYVLLGHNIPHYKRREDERKHRVKKPEVVVDIEAAKEKIRSAKTAEEFTTAADEFETVLGIFTEIQKTSYGYKRGWKKFDNLSTMRGSQHGFDGEELSEAKTIFGSGSIKPGQVVPWHHITSFAAASAEHKERIASLLDDDGIHDYRLTHEIGYIKSHGTHYCINEEGVVSSGTVPDYEIDFFLKQEQVLQVYGYIRDYYDQENSFIDAACKQGANFSGKFYDPDETASAHFGRYAKANKGIYDLIGLFNALPNNEKGEEYRNNNALQMISAQYKKDNPLLCVDDRGRLDIKDELFNFDNPIFQKHFGDNFQGQAIDRKNTQQQKLFDAIFSAAKKALDLWDDTQSRFTVLDAEINSLREYSKALEGEEGREEILEKKKRREHEKQFYEAKEEELKTVIYNVFCSALGTNSRWYHMNNLTEEQKNILAEYVVRDEKGIFVRLFNVADYEQYCDYFDILDRQQKNILSGDNTLTNMMTVVAKNIGYQTAKSKQALEAFYDSNVKEGFRRAVYKWQLHSFDLFQYLQTSREYNILKLCTTLKRIEAPEPDGYGHNDKKKSQRFENYTNIITQNSVMQSIARAINYQPNYSGQTPRVRIQTIDALVEFRNQMFALIGEEGKKDRDLYHGSNRVKDKPKQSLWTRTYGRMKSIFSQAVEYIFPNNGIESENIVKIRNKKFLNLIDKNIRGLIRRSLHQILSQGNSLDKFIKLYLFYHGEDSNYSGNQTRTDFLNDLTKKEKIFQKISNDSTVDRFWPDNALDHVKAFVFAKNTFIDDVELEDKTLNQLLDKVDALPAGRQKNECLHILLDRKLRSPFPETRERLFDIYAHDLHAKIGLDDGTEKYQHKLAVYIKALEGGQNNSWDNDNKAVTHDSLLSKKMSQADKYQLLRKISDTIISQEKASDMLYKSCRLNLSADDLAASYLYGVGVDSLTSEMDRNADSARAFVKFFNSKGENKDCESFSQSIGKKVRGRFKGHDQQEYMNKVLQEIEPLNCKILYDNFWSVPLEARAVIIARILKSAVVKQDNQNAPNPRQSWEQVFDVVMDTIIDPNDSSVEALYAQDIMHSYIKSRSDYERELILSAMMVANRNIGEDAGNVGKALKLFLENMGPAEIKLGQAIASHPGTPVKIRQKLQGLKNTADMPARWTTYQWIKNENIPEKFWKNKYMGKILGSASYYTVIAVGDDVLRILRPEAREKANKGFRVISETVNDLKEKDAISDLDYKELTASVQEMVKQAARMSHIETDHDIGQQQYESAQEIYNGVTITSGPEKFKLQVMDWKARGKNWMILERAQGETFNNLPEETAVQITYKKHIAKGYIVFEMSNILLGGKFDHDKHGAQLSVDPLINKIGIYDTGAMALTDPTHEEQRLLGHVIFDTIQSNLSGTDYLTAFSTSIAKKIDQLYTDGQDTQYLVEVKKSLLALGDFVAVLDASDIQEIMPGLEVLNNISPQIKAGILEKMVSNGVDAGQIESASTAFAKNKSVTIERNNVIPILNNIEVFDIDSFTPVKAKWFAEAFEELEIANSTQSSAPLKLRA